MFCSDCGAKLDGEFCWRCGACSHTAGASAVTSENSSEASDAAPVDWSDEVRYRVLIELPEVREWIARQSALSHKGLSAEEFLSEADAVLGPLVGATVPSGIGAELGYQLGSRLGVGTGKEREAELEWPVGRVIVSVLCSLARRNLAINSVHQAEDGCTFEARLPSGAFIMSGTVLVAVGRDGAGARVKAAAKVRGQMLDWGVSKRCLRNLFDDIAEFAPTDVVG